MERAVVAPRVLALNHLGEHELANASARVVSLAHQLALLVKRTKKNRNALINEAVRHFVALKQRAEWPQELLEAEAPEAVEPFEKHRSSRRAGPRFP
jgi:predicted transcriptional regulator